MIVFIRAVDRQHICTMYVYYGEVLFIKQTVGHTTHDLNSGTILIVRSYYSKFDCIGQKVVFIVNRFLYQVVIIVYV